MSVYFSFPEETQHFFFLNKGSLRFPLKGYGEKGGAFFFLEERKGLF